MTENKRFNVFDVDGTIFLEDHKEGSYHIGEIGNVDVNCLNDIADRLNELAEENEQLRKENDMFSCELSVSANKEISRNCRIAELEEENEELKSTIAQLIEQNHKNKELLLSDIRILEKALWCEDCENDYGRLKELRKEFMR